MSIQVALDLETTGFDADKDQIIEIAAIKFDGEKILETFETFINPEIPIPAMISHITGIHSTDLVDAPRFSEISEKLIDFLGNYPIVGHNIAFDVNFLQQKGLPLRNPLYDTLELSTILYPGLPSYSLDTLGRILKIHHKDKHRAMSDTHACFQLFLLLEKKLEEIPSTSYQEIKIILGKSSWSLKTFFLQKESHSNFHQQDAVSNSEKDAERETKTDSKSSLEISTNIKDFYEQNGYFSKTIENYERRPEQQKITEEVLKHFQNGNNLMLDSGIGNGKTLSYILAAALFALEKKEKIVISMQNQNLEKQIVEKDFDDVNKTLHNLQSNLNIKIAILKAPKNYICVQRLNLLKKKSSFLDYETTFLIKIILWLKKTEKGILSELSLQGKEFSLLEEICCNEFCLDHENKTFETCFFQKAKAMAIKADILVIDHHFLLQQANLEDPLLPDYNYLIIDEAHRLEKTTTDVLSQSIFLSGLQKPFLKLQEILKSNMNTAMFEQIFAKTAAKENLLEAQAKNDHIINKMEILFGLIGIYLEKNIRPSSFQYHLLLKPSDFETAEWKKIQIAGEFIIQFGKEIIHHLSQSVNPLPLENFAEFHEEFKTILLECEKKIHTLESIFQNQNTHEKIQWIFRGYEESISMKSAPLKINEFLEKKLFQRKKSVILISNIFSIENSLQFFRKQYCPETHFNEMILESFFKNPEKIKIEIAKDMKVPSSEGYFSDCNEIIQSEIKKNKGRTLVFFSSKKALSATYHTLAPKLKEEGFHLLAHQMTGGKGKILEHFKDEPENSAILALNNFWENLESIGEQLKCVIIQKLYFDPPDDPIATVRSQKHVNGFDEYFLPRAIMEFKQTYSSFIKSHHATGTVIILDGRVLQRDYGQSFLNSLSSKITVEYRS